MHIKPQEIEVPIMKGGDSRVVTVEAEEPRAGGESRCGGDFLRDTPHILPAPSSQQRPHGQLDPRACGSSLGGCLPTAPVRRVVRTGLHFPACTSGRAPEGQSSRGDLVLAALEALGSNHHSRSSYFSLCEARQSPSTPPWAAALEGTVRSARPFPPLLLQGSGPPRPREGPRPGLSTREDSFVPA